MEPMEMIANWEPTRSSFTRAEMIALMQQLSVVFDEVRLVDPPTGMQFTLDGKGDLWTHEYKCWLIWKKHAKCTYCISRRALVQHGRVTKFEFINDELHHITAKYVEMDGVPYSLEMVCKVPDETILEGSGRKEIVEAITIHNKRVYTDPLTGAYNRRYLDEMYQGDERERAVAILDADNFKRINDTYGHAAGDAVLKGVVKAIMSCVRSSDAVIRYGGDEFVIVFEALIESFFLTKLEQIRESVLKLEFPEMPGVQQTLSIGGAYGIDSVTNLIRRADKQLYQAKADGRNCVRLERYASISLPE